MRDVIAIDFDGTLCTVAEFPEIGQPIFPVIEAAKKRQKEGAALILWTCRTGDSLRSALEFCMKYELEFDAVNANLGEWKSAYGTDPRKIGATEYWDDKAVNPKMICPEMKRDFSTRRVSIQVPNTEDIPGDIGIEIAAIKIAKILLLEGLFELRRFDKLQNSLFLEVVTPTFT